MNVIKCEVCGHTWPNNLIIARNATNITFENVKTVCPKCNSATHVIEDGTYHFDEFGIAQLLRQIPKTDLSKLKQAAIGVKENGGTAQDLKDAISDINPLYSQLISGAIDLSKDENFRYWIDRLIKIIAIILGGMAIGNININTQINNPSSNQPATKDVSFSENYQRLVRVKNLETLKLKKESRDRTKAVKRR